MFGIKEEAAKGRGIEILQQRASLCKKRSVLLFMHRAFGKRIRSAERVRRFASADHPLYQIYLYRTIKKREKNTISPDYIVGNERISADIPKKRGWAFIYFIKINNAKEAQKVDNIWIYLTLCSKNTR